MVCFSNYGYGNTVWLGADGKYTTKHIRDRYRHTQHMNWQGLANWKLHSIGGCRCRHHRCHHCCCWFVVKGHTSTFNYLLATSNFTSNNNRNSRIKVEKKSYATAYLLGIVYFVYIMPFLSIELVIWYCSVYNKLTIMFIMSAWCVSFVLCLSSWLFVCLFVCSFAVWLQGKLNILMPPMREDLRLHTKFIDERNGLCVLVCLSVWFVSILVAFWLENCLNYDWNENGKSVGCRQEEIILIKFYE